MKIFSALRCGIINLYQPHSKNKQLLTLGADLAYDQTEGATKKNKTSKISDPLSFPKQQMPQEALHPKTASYINPQAIEIESSLKNPSKAKKFRDTNNLAISIEDSDLSQNITPNATNLQNEVSSLELSPNTANQKHVTPPHQPSYSLRSSNNSIDISAKLNKKQLTKKTDPQPKINATQNTQKPPNFAISMETFAVNDRRDLRANSNEDWQIFPLPAASQEQPTQVLALEISNSPIALLEQLALDVGKNPTSPLPAASQEQPAQVVVPEIFDSPEILLERFTQSLARNEDISQIFIQNQQLFNLLSTQYEEIQEIRDQESLKNFLLTKKATQIDDSNDQIFDEAIKRIAINQQKSGNFDPSPKADQNVEERLATMSLEKNPDLMIETQTQENADTNRKLDEQAITQQIQHFTTQLNGLKINHSPDQFTDFLNENSQLFINLNIDQDIRHIEELNALKNLLQFKASQDDEQQQQQKHLNFLVNIIEQHQQQNSALDNSSQISNSNALYPVQTSLPKAPDATPQLKSRRLTTTDNSEGQVAQARQRRAALDRAQAAKWRESKTQPPKTTTRTLSKTPKEQASPSFSIESLRNDEERAKVVEKLDSHHLLNNTPQTIVSPRRGISVNKSNTLRSERSNLEAGARALSQSLDFLSLPK